MEKSVNMEVSKELFREISYHLLYDKAPSKFLSIISEQPSFTVYPFPMLLELKNTEQSKTHHPEGNVWNHTLLVVDEAAKKKSQSKNQIVFMWAALLHDIGKPPTTKIRKNKITSYDHDKVGAKLAEEFLSTLMDDSLFIQQVIALVRYHMHILYVVNTLPFADMEGMKEDTNVEEIALLGLCDRLGRKGVNVKKEEKTINLFLRKCGKFV